MSNGTKAFNEVLAYIFFFSFLVGAAILVGQISAPSPEERFKHESMTKSPYTWEKNVEIEGEKIVISAILTKPLGQMTVYFKYNKAKFRSESQDNTFEAKECSGLMLEGNHLYSKFPSATPKSLLNDCAAWIEGHAHRVLRKDVLALKRLKQTPANTLERKKAEKDLQDMDVQEL